MAIAIESVTLRGDDRVVYARAIQALAGTGASIEDAAKEFAAAYTILRGVPIIEAARFYAARQPKYAGKQVSDVVAELV